MVKRIITSILVIGQLTSGVAYAMPERGAVSLGAPARPAARQPIGPMANRPWDVHVPEALGTVREFHQGTNGKLIIHFQDAHGNFGGQKSLAGAMADLMSRYQGLGLVLVEGSSRDVSLDRVKHLADAGQWKSAAYRYLFDGVISGEEYLNLTSDEPVRLLGIEERAVYDQELAVYTRLLARKNALVRYVRTARTALERVKARLYPAELLDYEKDRPILEQNAALIRLARRAGIPAEQFLQMRALERLDARLEAIGVRAKKADAAGGNEAALKAAAALYARYSDAARRVDLDAAMQERENLEEKVYASAASDRRIIQIHALARYLDLLDHAFSIQMTNREFELLKLSRAHFGSIAWPAFINDQLAALGYAEDLLTAPEGLDEGLDLAFEFYEFVGQRDRIFAGNTEKSLKQNEADAAFLITGGYHTENLMKLLRDRGYSYLVVTPRVDGETDWKSYEKNLLASSARPAVGAASATKRQLGMGEPGAASRLDRYENPATARNFPRFFELTAALERELKAAGADEAPGLPAAPLKAGARLADMRLGDAFPQNVALGSGYFPLEHQRWLDDSDKWPLPENPIRISLGQFRNDAAFFLSDNTTYYDFRGVADYLAALRPNQELQVTLTPFERFTRAGRRELGFHIAIQNPDGTQPLDISRAILKVGGRFLKRIQFEQVYSAGLHMDKGAASPAEELKEISPDELNDVILQYQGYVLERIAVMLLASDPADTARLLYHNSTATDRLLPHLDPDLIHGKAVVDIKRGGDVQKVRETIIAYLRMRDRAAARGEADLDANEPVQIISAFPIDEAALDLRAYKGRFKLRSIDELFRGRDLEFELEPQVKVSALKKLVDVVRAGPESEEEGSRRKHLQSLQQNMTVLDRMIEAKRLSGRIGVSVAPPDELSVQELERLARSTSMNELQALQVYVTETHEGAMKHSFRTPVYTFRQLEILHVRLQKILEALPQNGAPGDSHALGRIRRDIAAKIGQIFGHLGTHITANEFYRSIILPIAGGEFEKEGVSVRWSEERDENGKSYVVLAIEHQQTYIDRTPARTDNGEVGVPIPVNFKYRIEFRGDRVEAPLVPELNSVNVLRIPPSRINAETFEGLRDAWRGLVIADPVLNRRFKSSEIVIYRYQEEAVRAALDDIRAKSSAVVDMAMGAGKTVVAYETMKRYWEDVLASRPAKRPLAIYMTDNTQILDDGPRKLAQCLGDRFSHSQMYDRDYDDSGDIIFTTPRSLMSKDAKRLKELLVSRQVRMVIVDEAHHLPANEWKEVISIVRQAAEDEEYQAAIFGMTATLMPRLDGGNVMEAFGDRVSYSFGLNDAWKGGYLVRIDYAAADLRICPRPGPIYPYQPEYREYQRTRYNLRERFAEMYALMQERTADVPVKRILYVAPRIEKANELAHYFNENTHESVVVLTGEDKRDRNDWYRAHYQAWRDGQWPSDPELAKFAVDAQGRPRPVPKIVIAVKLLLEGADVPGLTYLGIWADTDSTIKFVQEVGRGTRPYPFKTKLIVDDLVGIYRRVHMLRFLESVYPNLVRQSRPDAGPRDFDGEDAPVAQLTDTGYMNVTETINLFLNDVPQIVWSRYPKEAPELVARKPAEGEQLDRFISEKLGRDPMEDRGAFIAFLRQCVTSDSPEEVRKKFIPAFETSGYRPKEQGGPQSQIPVNGPTSILFYRLCRLFLEADPKADLAWMAEAFPEFNGARKKAYMNRAANLRLLRDLVFGLNQERFVGKLAADLGLDTTKQEPPADPDEYFLTQEAEALADQDRAWGLILAEGYDDQHPDGREIQIENIVTDETEGWQRALIRLILRTPAVQGRLDENAFEANQTQFLTTLLLSGLDVLPKPAIQSLVEGAHRNLQAYLEIVARGSAVSTDRLEVWLNNAAAYITMHQRVLKREEIEDLADLIRADLAQLRSVDTAKLPGGSLGPSGSAHQRVITMVSNLLNALLGTDPVNVLHDLSEPAEDGSQVASASQAGQFSRKSILFDPSAQGFQFDEIAAMCEAGSGEVQALRRVRKGSTESFEAMLSRIHRERQARASGMTLDEKIRNVSAILFLIQQLSKREKSSGATVRVLGRPVKEWISEYVPKAMIYKLREALAVWGPESAWERQSNHAEILERIVTIKSHPRSYWSQVKIGGRSLDALEEIVRKFPQLKASAAAPQSAAFVTAPKGTGAQPLKTLSFDASFVDSISKESWKGRSVKERRERITRLSELYNQRNPARKTVGLMEFFKGILVPSANEPLIHTAIRMIDKKSLNDADVKFLSDWEIKTLSAGARLAMDDAKAAIERVRLGKRDELERAVEQYRQAEAIYKQIKQMDPEYLNADLWNAAIRQIQAISAQISRLGGDISDLSAQLVEDSTDEPAAQADKKQEPADGPAAEPAVDSVAKTVVEPADETVAEPAAEKVVESSVETAAEPVAEPAAAPVAESVAEPVAPVPVDEPSAVSEPTTEARRSDAQPAESPVDQTGEPEEESVAETDDVQAAAAVSTTVKAVEPPIALSLAEYLKSRGVLNEDEIVGYLALTIQIAQSADKAELTVEQFRNLVSAYRDAFRSAGYQKPSVEGFANALLAITKRKMAENEAASLFVEFENAVSRVALETRRMQLDDLTEDLQVQKRLAAVQLIRSQTPVSGESTPSWTEAELLEGITRQVISYLEFDPAAGETFDSHVRLIAEYLTTESDPQIEYACEYVFDDLEQTVRGIFKKIGYDELLFRVRQVSSRKKGRISKWELLRSVQEFDETITENQVQRSVDTWNRILDTYRPAWARARTGRVEFRKRLGNLDEVVNFLGPNSNLAFVVRAYFGFIDRTGLPPSEDEMSSQKDLKRLVNGKKHIDLMGLIADVNRELEPSDYAPIELVDASPMARSIYRVTQQFIKDNPITDPTVETLLAALSADMSMTIREEMFEKALNDQANIEACLKLDVWTEGREMGESGVMGVVETIERIQSEATSRGELRRLTQDLSGENGKDALESRIAPLRPEIANLVNGTSNAYIYENADEFGEALTDSFGSDQALSILLKEAGLELRDLFVLWALRRMDAPRTEGDLVRMDGMLSALQNAGAQWGETSATPIDQETVLRSLDRVNGHLTPDAYLATDVTPYVTRAYQDPFLAEFISALEETVRFMPKNMSLEDFVEQVTNHLEGLTADEIRRRLYYQAGIGAEEIVILSAYRDLKKRSSNGVLMSQLVNEVDQRETSSSVEEIQARILSLQESSDLLPALSMDPSYDQEYQHGYPDPKTIQSVEGLVDFYGALGLVREDADGRRRTLSEITIAHRNRPSMRGPATQEAEAAYQFLANKASQPIRIRFKDGTVKSETIKKPAYDQFWYRYAKPVGARLALAHGLIPAESSNAVRLSNAAWFKNEAGRAAAVSQFPQGRPVPLIARDGDARGIAYILEAQGPSRYFVRGTDGRSAELILEAASEESVPTPLASNDTQRVVGEWGPSIRLLLANLQKMPGVAAAECPLDDLWSAGNRSLFTEAVTALNAFINEARKQQDGQGSREIFVKFTLQGKGIDTFSAPNEAAELARSVLGSNHWTGSFPRDARVILDLKDAEVDQPGFLKRAGSEESGFVLSADVQKTADALQAHNTIAKLLLQLNLSASGTITDNEDPIVRAYRLMTGRRDLRASDAEGFRTGSIPAAAAKQFKLLPLAARLAETLQNAYRQLTTIHTSA